jgi:hypothetical protein
MQPPVIPPRVSSLLPAAKVEALEQIRKRRFTSFSKITSASSVEDFIEAKKFIVEADLELIDKQREYLCEALGAEAITQDQHTKAIAEIESPENTQQRHREYGILVRHKKMLKEDLEEMTPNFSDFDDAYASLLCQKVEAARSKAPPGPSFNQSKFRTTVMSFYGAERDAPDGGKQGYCVVTGWHNHVMRKGTLRPQTKASHIVPKSLRGPDLSYLFGVGETLLQDPRNGMFVSSFQK